MVRAAPHVVRSSSLATLFGGLTVSKVARAAGVTRATFYAYWPTIDAYVEDLLEELGDHLPPDVGGDRPAALAGTSGGRPSVPDMVVEECERNLRRVMEDPNLALRLGFNARTDEPRVARALRRHYRRTDRRATDLYGPVRASWGRETRPPLSDDEVQAVYTAVTEGLALRRLADPEVVPPELCGRVVLALTMFLTRRLDDPRSLDDVLATTDSWPAVGVRLRGAGPDRPRSRTTPLDAATARRVTREARRLLGSMGWHEVGLGDIASALGLPEEALLRAFGSKAGLGMAVFMLTLHDRFKAHRTTGDPATDLRHMLAIGRDELRRAPEVTVNVAQVLLGTSATPAAGVVQWNPMTDLADQIARAQQAGQLSGDLDPTDLADTLARALLVEALPRVRQAPSGRGTVELLLAGAGLPPGDGSMAEEDLLGGAAEGEPAADAFPG